MGFIKAFAGALGGTLADQWKDFLTVPAGVSQTALFFPAQIQGTNAGRGSNTKYSKNIISNGSKIVVPEGYGLVTMTDGGLTGLITEPGGYTFYSDDINAKSVFAGDGFFESTIKQSWERFKFGGIPGSAAAAFFVNLKDVPNNRFGTQAPIYWFDAFMNTQVSAVVRGSYVLNITDPILFIKTTIPAAFMSSAQTFDLSDPNNMVGDQLFNEVIGSLTAAFSEYCNDPSRGMITKIQSDSIGFASALAKAVDDNYRWSSDRGLTISKVTFQAIEYDAETLALLQDVKKADALSGGRGASFMQQSIARGVQAMGENGGGGADMAFMGMGINTMQNVAATQSTTPATPAAASDDPAVKIREYKAMLDEGLLTAEEFAALKAKLLGL